MFVNGDEAADVPAYIGGGSTVDGEDGAMIKQTTETKEALRKAMKRRTSIVRNINRPAERKESLVNYQTDQEVA
jgi:hypothetical protein